MTKAQLMEHKLGNALRLAGRHFRLVDGKLIPLGRLQVVEGVIIRPQAQTAAGLLPRIRRWNERCPQKPAQPLK